MEHIIDNMCSANVDIQEIVNKTGKDKEFIQKRIQDISKFKSQLEKLIERPIIKQKTDEWYLARKNMITASDFAQALGKGKFGSVKQFYKKKCGKDDFIYNEYVLWGNMFEDVAISIYKSLYNVDVYEFGLIKDDDINFFGASPDGISSNGIMIEIKCPKKREITGDIPLQYYYQVMGQLKVCNLEECDYFECGFKLFYNREEYLENIDNCEYKGYIIKLEDGSFKYSELNDDEPSEDENNIYWYLDKYNIKRITRDDEFIKENILKLEKVWDKVLTYREDSNLFTKEIDTPPRKRKSFREENKLTGYSFIDDEN